MLLYVFCGDSPVRPLAAPSGLGHEDVRTFDLPGLPGRRDLKFLDELPTRFARGSTPSLEDIAAQPDVAHLGAPQPDPHEVTERVRLIVHGSDAALATIVAKLMRIDALWVQVAFIPLFPDTSPVARNWGLLPDANPEQHLQFALESAVRPTTLIRDDHGQVVLGAAEITGPNGASGEMIGEAIVDSSVLYNYDPQRAQMSAFTHGLRMMPTMGAPGLVAVPLPAPENKKGGWWTRWRRKENIQPPVLEGRALQTGGVDLQVTRDGLAHPRALKSVTFYRHLRDGQFVRN